MDAWNFILIIPTLFLCLKMPKDVPNVFTLLLFFAVVINALTMHRYVYVIIKKISTSARVRRSVLLLIGSLVLAY